MNSAFKVSMQIGASLGRTVRTTFQGAEGQLRQLGRSIQSVRQQQQAIRTFNLDTSRVAASQRTFREARRELLQLRRAVRAQSAPTQQMQKDLARAKQRVNRLGETLSIQQQRLQKNRTALKTLGLSTRDLSQDNERLSRSVDKLNRRYQRLDRLMEQQRKRAVQRSEWRGQVLDTVALGAAVVAPLSIAIDFEASVAKLGAITRASTEDQQRLSQEARTLGERTQFSASQATEAMTFLGMAGFNTQQILASTAGVLDLAMAAGEELGVTADISSNILSGFNLQAEAMGRVGNVLTATFTRTNTTLATLGESMKYAAPIAAATGSSLEEVAAMAGLLGSAGIQAGNAGRALQQVFARLSAPTGEAADVLAELGIETQDAMGNLRSVPVLFQEIADGLSTLGSAQRAGAINDVFGQVALASVTKLLEQSQGGQLAAMIATLNAAEQNQEVATVAARMADNTRGSLKRLGSALESVAISIGSTLLPIISDGAAGLAVFASGVSAFAQHFPLLTKVVVGSVLGLMALRAVVVASQFTYSVLASAVGSLQIAYTVLSTRLSLTNLNLVRLAVVSRLSSVWTGIVTAAQWAWNVALSANPIGIVIGLIGGLVAAGVWLVKNWDSVTAFFVELWENLKSMTGNAVDWLLKAIKTLLNPVGMIADVIASVSNSVLGGETRDLNIRQTVTTAQNRQPQTQQALGTALATTATLATPVNYASLPEVPTAATLTQTNQYRLDAPITIHASPGMDEKAVGEEVQRQLTRRQQQLDHQRRAALFDITE